MQAQQGARDNSGMVLLFLAYAPGQERRGVLRWCCLCLQVLDLMDVASLWSETGIFFDRVQPGLLTRLLNKSVRSAIPYANSGCLLLSCLALNTFVFSYRKV
jgi:hypothetical protein